MSSKAFKLVDELRPAQKSDDGGNGKREPARRPVSTDQRRAEEGMLAPCGNAVPDTDGVRITEITPMEGGEWVSIIITEGKQRRYVRLLTEQYAVLKPSVGDASAALVEALDRAGKLCDAVRKGMELLGYGAMSRRRLAQKLTLRGFDKETMTSAVDYLDDHGFLPETDDAIRFAEQGVRKLWGPRRIREDLFARGFSAEAVSVAMESLEDVNFAENCGRAILKKYGGIPKDRVEIKKMVAALMRLGYTSEQIREALR